MPEDYVIEDIVNDIGEFIIYQGGGHAAFLLLLVCPVLIYKDFFMLSDLELETLVVRDYGTLIGAKTFKIYNERKLVIDQLEKRINKPDPTELYYLKLKEWLPIGLFVIFLCILALIIFYIYQNRMYLDKRGYYPMRVNIFIRYLDGRLSRDCHYQGNIDKQLVYSNIIFQLETLNSTVFGKISNPDEFKQIRTDLITFQKILAENSDYNAVHKIAKFNLFLDKILIKNKKK